MLKGSAPYRASLVLGLSAAPLLFGLSHWDLILLAAGVFLVVSAYTLILRNRRHEDCPRCGARLSNFFGDSHTWLKLAFTRFCPECGWDADSNGRRAAPVRRR